LRRGLFKKLNHAPSGAAMSVATREEKKETMRSAKKISLMMLFFVLAATMLFAQQKPLREPDVVFVPTPQEVVDQMMKLANVHAGDVLYDLGCGDGRTVITAAKLGARAIGIDINPVRIQESNDNAAKNGMTGKVTFRLEDLFEANFKDATVVTLYLLPSLNVKLRPKLWNDLKPGTRIVSHDFDMGDWKAEKTIDVDGHTLYFWTVPEPSKRPVVTD
jgi:2-polyprenyl-3-methyl-5-hydroxy-6-metoxy-1,4-benzoquinol methylase